MTHAKLDQSRAILQVAGPDAATFLQSLLTNDVERAAATSAIYAALLTPQGKYLADMFVLRPEAEVFLLDIPAQRAAQLSARLGMYKLRAKLEISPQEGMAAAFSADAFETGDHAYRDPRAEDMGWRAIVSQSFAPAASKEELNAFAIAQAAPQDAIDLIPDETFPLEAGLERLNGVDFRKGCYVGQEIAARMKHKATLRRGLFRLVFAQEGPQTGAPVISGVKEIGQVGSVFENKALAVLRIDRADDELTAADVKISHRQQI